MNSKLFTAVAIAGLSAIHPAFSHASEYPSRPIRLVIGYAPGGAADVMARVIADGLSRRLGQPVTVDNKPGAGATIATSILSRAQPDGYTLGLGTANAYGVDQHLYKVEYTGDDFTPIARLTTAPLILAINRDMGVGSVQELVDTVKANPGKLNYASSGIGGSPHLAGLMFEQAAGAPMVHVPFKGGAPAMTSIVSGDVQLSFGTPASVLPMGRDGRLTMLGVTSSDRSPVAPDLPTLAESGLPGFEYSFWFALLGPAGLPAPIVDKLFAAANDVLKDETVKEKLLVDGSIPAPSESPSEFSEFARKDGARALERLQKAGVTLN